jgi:hypothetical protein
MAATTAPATQTYRVRPLDESTWPAFAALVEHNNGIFGGCWCIGFRPEGGGANRAPELTAGAVPAGFLFNGALSTYEKLGFTRDRQIGKHRWVVTRRVSPQSWSPSQDQCGMRRPSGTSSADS